MSHAEEPLAERVLPLIVVLDEIAARSEPYDMIGFRPMAGELVITAEQARKLLVGGEVTIGNGNSFRIESSVITVSLA